jgi:hypothetical protein
MHPRAKTPLLVCMVRLRFCSSLIEVFDFALPKIWTILRHWLTRMLRAIFHFFFLGILDKHHLKNLNLKPPSERFLQFLHPCGPITHEIHHSYPFLDASGRISSSIHHLYIGKRHASPRYHGNVLKTPSPPLPGRHG